MGKPKAKGFIVIGFPDRVDDNFRSKLYGSITTKEHALKSAEYYNEFYGGTRDIRIIPIEEVKETW